MNKNLCRVDISKTSTEQDNGESAPVKNARWMASRVSPRGEDNLIGSPRLSGWLLGCGLTHLSRDQGQAI